MPRFKPYSKIGIRRIPCVRCGAPSHAQWNICMDNVGDRQQYRGICLECDIGMNEIVAKYVFGDTAATYCRLQTYRRKQYAG